MTDLLLALANQALVEPDALQVFGDHLQETAWFDARVMQTMWPIGKYPRDGYRTKAKRDRAKIDREAHKAGYPGMFAAFAAKPTASFVRAILAVLIFGSWRRRRWLMIDKMRRSTPGLELGPVLDYRVMTVDGSKIRNVRERYAGEG